MITEVPYQHAKEMKKVLHKCMVADNPINIETEDGIKTYRFGIDSAVYVNWGEKVTDEVSMQYFGVPLDSWL